MVPKVLWNSLLATPALVGAALLVSSNAIAAEVQSVVTEAEALTTEVTVTPDAVAPVAEAPVQLAQVSPETAPAATSSVASLDEIMQYSNEGAASQAQVTSITQLSDVQPTDWAFQALQSLVERYGCIAGYPDGTYRGQRAMTRFEFAAGMNACLDRISELIAASTADLATKEDLATLQRLQEEFAAELAAIRGRVDALEARTAELEANQFSTTTKLNGEVIFAAGANFTSTTDSDEDGRGNQNIGEGDQAIAGYRVRLNFDTSFTGEDLLRTRLQAREFDNFNGFGNNTQWQWSSDAPGDGSSTVRIDDLLYTFPVADRAQIIIGANSIGDSDFVSSTISPFDSSGSGSITTNFGTPPQYNFIPGGTGLGAIVQLNDNLSLDFGYAAGDAGDPSEGSGIFNGSYGLIAQLTFLSDFVDAAFTYSNSFSTDGFGSSGGFTLGDYIGAINTDDGREGGPEIANIYAATVNVKPADWIEIGGGAMYAPVIVLDGEQGGRYRIWSYWGTLGFPDLGGDGNLLGFTAGVPPRISGMSESLHGTLGSLGDDNDTRQDAAFLVEGFYRFRINDNIAITPGVTWISDPGSDNGNKDTIVGAVRTTFTF